MSDKGISVSQDKVKAIQEWPQPETVHRVRSFLGLASYYRRFVKGFAKLASPLYALLSGNPRKNAPIQWLPRQTHSFQALKTALTTTPVLLSPDPTKPYVCDTDSSDFVTGAVLYQKGDDDKLHPIAFTSKRLDPAQRNYPAQERELLAILQAWRAWRIYLEGAVETTVVRSDHASLQYLKKQKLPSRRLARWIEEFGEMDIRVEYKKGSTHIVPDLLSRRADLMAISAAENLESEEFEVLDWPLLVPYLLEQRDVPSDIPAVALKNASSRISEFRYDAKDETLAWIEKHGSENTPFITFRQRAELLDVLHREYGHRDRDGTLDLLEGRG